MHVLVFYDNPPVCMKCLQSYSFMFRVCNALSIAHHSFPFMLTPMNAMRAYGAKNNPC